MDDSDGYDGIRERIKQIYVTGIMGAMGTGESVWNCAMKEQLSITRRYTG